MKELEKENTRLKRLVAELSLEKQVLKRRGLGKLLSPERRRCAVKDRTTRLLAAGAVARGAVEKCGMVRKDRVQCIWRREGLKYPPSKDPADGCGWRMWFVCAAEARAGESGTKVLRDPAPHHHVRQGVDHLQTGSVSGAARGTAAEQ